MIAHADLAAVAEVFEDATPYTPKGRDAFDWLSTAAGPYDMSSIGYAKDVQMLVEWRAACIWCAYWLASDGEARQAAGVVLGDVRGGRRCATAPATGPTFRRRSLQDAAALHLQYRPTARPGATARR